MSQCKRRKDLHFTLDEPFSDSYVLGINSVFSRVLRDSITHYVGRSVRWLVGPSVLAFLAFTGGFCITAPAQSL